MTNVKKYDNDIVIVSAKRTPVGKAHRGSFKDTPVDHLLTQCIKGALDYCSIDPNLIEDIVFGSVLLPGGGVVEARIAAIKAGIPIVVPIMTINRQCASGLESLKLIADRLRNNEIKIGMAGGFEIMSQNGLKVDFNTTVTENDTSQHSKGCLIPMGITSENIAERYEINRDLVDEYAFKSHLKAYKAQFNNDYCNEIVQVTNIEGELITKDDGIREPNLVKMKSLKSCFKENGVSTAANSSQLSDGCAIIILMKRKTAKKYSFPILGKYIDCVSVGCEPEVMGISPVPAIKKLLFKNNLNINDIDLWEINEAFGSQIVYCAKELQIEKEKLNIKGGSIAIGHPIGSTGARLVCTLLNHSLPGNLGIVSLCAATGMGIAGLFMRE